MSIQKKEYELSVWSETLEEHGQKSERKEYIIGAHDMEYQGRATGIKFVKKLNGTHELTFQMPDKWYDSEKGDFVRNEFIDQLFNERKLKLHYRGEWYEFYIKSIADAKKFKSYVKTYTCSDAFIDELSRNGYGITFDEALYNNVEEMGTFTEEILEDSVWYYSPENNWGDFTEYSEEKLYKIPVQFFNNLRAYELNYNIDDAEEQIINLTTNEKRNIEMGDDLAREKGYYWDQMGNNGRIKHPLIGQRKIVKNDGYIYVFMSCLDFCYKTTSAEGLVATEEVQYYGDTKKFAVAPTTVDPSALIQFMAFPEDAIIEVDEAGMIVNKDYHYVMTVGQWNEYLEQTSNYFYKFESLSNEKRKYFLTKEQAVQPMMSLSERRITGNWAVYYEDYLSKIGDTDVLTGKKISIANHTEINITDKIDQYVTVYNSKSSKFNNLYVNPDGNWKEVKNSNYRVCSVNKTRQIIPQLARNLVENAIEIKSEDGWAVAATVDNINKNSTTIKFIKKENENIGQLEITPTNLENNPTDDANDSNKRYRTIINFGLVGQEYEIVANKIYCIGVKGTFNGKDKIIIGKGGMVSSGEYEIEEKFSLNYSQMSNNFYFIKFKNNIKNPYFAFQLSNDLGLRYIDQVYFFEAYTKGVDQFGNEAEYKYSGRTFFNGILNGGLNNNNFSISKSYTEEDIRKKVIFENDIMPGDTYEYKEYFIQQLSTNSYVADTYKQKEFLSPDAPELGDIDNTNLSYRDLPYSSKDFTDDDLTISTKYIDLNKCPYYNSNNELKACDCSYGNRGAYDKFCMYQKYGYCPYLFQSEKHCRKIRTLKGEKSNRFNLTQEIGKVFKVYPCYWINHEENGKTKIEERTDKNGKKYEMLDKRVYYITEKGKENELGFRYEINLSNISRTIKSDQIVSKLYVQDVDSNLSKTGLSSIKTAPDNISKDSFIIDFSYYIAKGMLSEKQVYADLYGTNEGDMAYLRKLGHYNEEYDKISNLIINLSSQSFTELEANVKVNMDGIEAAQKELQKLKKQADKYKPTDETTTPNQTYNNYLTKIDQQIATLNQLVKELMCDENITNEDIGGNITGLTLYERIFGSISIADFKETDWYKKHAYLKYGMLGQYNREYQQIQDWRKQQAEYLKQINLLSYRFFQKYEPYLKEGTWSDSNYLTDNAYYFGAKEVAAQGAIPKVEYNISVIDLQDLPEYEEYDFDLADTTYVEDIGMFGVSEKTGLPNRLKVLISEISYDLDQPKNNSIKVQNFTTQFEDLFQQVSASVQSLSFNENIYKRSSNFTSNQSIKEESLQGTLDNNNVTLLKTQENNIELDAEGQFGSDINNHSNKYKLNGQGMFFSNNGGQSWEVGVGPSGINADYIKTGTLDAGKIRIVDNDYVYFLWDKGGIAAFRDPADSNLDTVVNDYALFNKFGLSLIDNSQLRLRAGYRPTSFIGDSYSFNPNDSTEGDIGFYLYDDSGNEIFSTTTTDNQTARIKVLGEMLAYGGGSSNNPIYETKYNLTSGGRGRKINTVYVYDFSEMKNFKNTKEIFDNLIQYSDPIKIIKNNQEYIYENYLWNWQGTSYYFDNEQKNIIQNNQHEIEYNENNEIINDWEGINLFPYLKTGISDNIVFLIDDIDTSSSATSNNSLIKYPYYYYKENNRYVKKNEQVYSNNNLINNYLIWKNQTLTTTQKETSPIIGAGGVYINNKIFTEILTSNNIYHDYRMFSCLWKDSGNASNILTVLRNGTLTMGGLIKNTNGKTITDIPDEVEIENPQFVVQNDGTVRMNFTKFLDIYSNRTVMEIIETAFTNSIDKALNDFSYDLPVDFFPTNTFDEIKKVLVEANESQSLMTMSVACIKAVLGLAEKLNGKYLLTGTKTKYGYSETPIRLEWDFL